MDPVGGMQSVEKLRQAGNGEGKMYVVNNAGHHREFIVLIHAAHPLLISDDQSTSIIPKLLTPCL